MATTKQIVDRVVEIVQDGSFTRGVILDLVNRGLGEIAGLVKLPLLLDDDTVNTGVAPSAALPTGYSRGLFFVSSLGQGRRIKIEESFLRFLGYYPTLDSEGDVARVSVRGLSLFYQPIPATPDTLTIHFYRNPTLLALDTDVPGCLPDHLQIPLLSCFAAKEIFAVKEDGIDGKKVNTEFYYKMFMSSLGALVTFVGPPPAEPIYVEDESESIDDLFA